MERTANISCKDELTLDTKGSNLDVIAFMSRVQFAHASYNKDEVVITYSSASGGFVSYALI